MTVRETTSNYLAPCSYSLMGVSCFENPNMGVGFPLKPTTEGTEGHTRFLLAKSRAK